jgi:hypothetical protein
MQSYRAITGATARIGIQDDIEMLASFFGPLNGEQRHSDAPMPLGRCGDRILRD